MGTLDMNEEAVSQMIIDMLTEEYNYPPSNIVTEVPASLGNARFRADIVVYSDNKPHILIEVKNTKKILHESKSQLEKISNAIKPNFTILTNGLNYQFYQVIKDNFSISLKEIADIPKFKETIEDIGAYSQEDLVTLSPTRYLTMMWRHFDILREESYHPFDCFKYLLLLYAAKKHDEETPNPSFIVEPNPEISKNMILGLVNNLLDANEGLYDVRIPFRAEYLYQIIFDLQKTSLSKSSDAFKEILPTLITRFGRDLAEYSTPEIIAKLILDTLRPGPSALFLDPACGLGGFLLKIAETDARVTGMEISSETSHLANLILLLSGITGSVSQKNSLIIDIEDENKYDYVAVHPPFGHQISEPMWDYKLYNNQSRAFSEELFVEAVLRYLKPNGMGAILVPNRFLFHSDFFDARQFLLQNSVLKGIFRITPDLYDKWFKITSNLLIFEKNNYGTRNDPVFFSKLSRNNIEDAVQNFRRFLQGENVKDNDSQIITSIMSIENLDFDYIQGSKYLNSFNNSHFFELRRIADVISGTSLSRVGDTGDRGSYYYIRASNIGDGTVDLSQAESITVSDPHSKYLAQPNDVLFSRAGTIGKVAIVKSETNLVIGSNVVILRIKDSMIKPEFLLGFLLSNLGKRQLDMYTTGSTISHISSTNLGKIKIPVYDLKTQESVVDLLQDLVSLKKEEEDLFNKINQRRKSVLNQLDSTFKEVY